MSNMALWNDRDSIWPQRFQIDDSVIIKRGKCIRHTCYIINILIIHLYVYIYIYVCVCYIIHKYTYIYIYTLYILTYGIQLTYGWELAHQSQITREGFHEFHPNKITFCV